MGISLQVDEDHTSDTSQFTKRASKSNTVEKRTMFRVLASPIIFLDSLSAQKMFNFLLSQVKYRVN